jgi:ankyrin repeat protein
MVGGVQADEIHRAVMTGDNARVEELLKGDPKLVNAKDSEQWAPLHLAVLFNRTETVKLLLSMGADPNVQDNEGWTALHTAAWTGHADMARLLLERRAEVDARSKSGWTPLHLAASATKTELETRPESP